jgi:hypothetical protein
MMLFKANMQEPTGAGFFKSGMFNNIILSLSIPAGEVQPFTIQSYVT